MIAVFLAVAALIVTTISVVFWMSKAPQIEEPEEAREKVETKASAFAAYAARIIHQATLLNAFA